MVVRLQGLAQRVKGVFTQVRQLMHHDHAQQRFRQGFEDVGNFDFVLALELAARHETDELVLAQDVIDDVQAGINAPFAERITATHVLLFDALSAVLQGGGGLDQMLGLRRGALSQPGAELAPVNQLLDLLLQAGALSAKVLKRGQGRCVLSLLERPMIQESRR